jgi:hypothetical protein
MPSATALKGRVNFPDWLTAISGRLVTAPACSVALSFAVRASVTSVSGMLPVLVTAIVTVKLPSTDVDAGAEPATSMPARSRPFTVNGATGAEGDS